MGYLEIIEIRATESNNKQLESDLEEFIKELSKENNNVIVKILINSKMENDFSLHIKHKTSEIIEGGSHLGLILVSALKKYGLVNHSIWIEKMDSENFNRTMK